MLIIDRFEDGVAIIEADGGFQSIDISLLPDGVKEGDILIYENGNYNIDTTATNIRRSQLNKLQKTLWEQS